MSDVKKNEQYKNHFLTRSLASLALVMNSDIDLTSSCQHITDGFFDIGIDALYLDEKQQVLFIIQSKWRKDGTGSITQEEIYKFVDGIKRIINFDLKGTNDKIQKKKSEIELALTSMNYKIHAIFIHTGNVTLNNFVKKPLDELISSTNDDANELVIFSEILYKDIYAYLAHGQEEEIILEDVILMNWGKINTPYKSYYGVISAAALGSWYRKYGNLLFAKNIRYYKGSTDVNDGIKKSLLEEPEHFYYYNNGIKLLCKCIRRKAKDSTNHETGLFRLEGVSLVNGAQTVGSIGSVFAEKPEQVAKANVIIQIIDLSQVSEETTKQITKLSNTQNRIENRDYVSLDPTQEKIRQELSFHNFYYLYKSGDKITSPETQITYDEAIIALACLHSDISYSTLAKRNIGALSEDISNEPYKILINTKTNTIALINSAITVRCIEDLLRSKKEMLAGVEKLVVVYGNRFIAYFVLQKLRTRDHFFDSILVNENLRRSVSSIVTKVITPLAEAINCLYPDSYPANIFKNEKKCQKIYTLLYN